MKRRSFVKASFLTGVSATCIPSEKNSTALFTKNSTEEFYELRIYNLKNESQQKIVEDYYQKASLPALNRMGIKPIGVFTEFKPIGQSKLIVLIPYRTIEQFLQIGKKLENDSIYKKEANLYLNAPASQPAYEHIESSLLQAFAHMPLMETNSANKRMFELRQYQSASEAAGKKKIEMFNDKGEIDIFKRLGFKPVFFGETIIGTQRPNLTYMITFEDIPSHDKLWKAFGQDIEWKKISSVPEYADSLLVSKINSTFIIPTSYSQI